MLRWAIKCAANSYKNKAISESKEQVVKQSNAKENLAMLKRKGY